MFPEQPIQWFVTSPEPMITVRECQDALKQLMEPLMVKHLGAMKRTNDLVETYPQNHSPISPQTQIHETWLWFLQEVALVRCSNSLVSVEAPAAVDSISNLFMSALLHVKLLSIFDEALEDYIVSHRTSLPGSYRGALHYRLEFLDSHGKIQYTQRLRDIKNMRNAVGHTPTTPTNWHTQQVSANELDQSIDDVEKVLQQLGIVGPRPLYETFATRNVIRDHPDKPSVYMTHIYQYGVKEGENVIIQFMHEFDFFRLDEEPDTASAL